VRPQARPEAGESACLCNVSSRFFNLLAGLLTGLGIDLVRFLGASLRSRTALAAENLFLRKQPALYRERQVKPRRASDPLRLTLVLLARCFAWREALTIANHAVSSVAGKRFTPE